MDTKLTKKIAFRVATITLVVNFSLVIIKLLAGIFGHSQALISDAVNSAADVISTIIIIIGVSLASKPIDSCHPYGHERLECVIAVILAIILLGTGGVIGYNGVTSLINGWYLTAQIPNALAIGAVCLTLLTKQYLFVYTVRKAKEIGSVSLKAGAWDHLEDVITALGCLAGIIGAMCGLPILDVIASIIICLIIVWASFKIFIEAVDKMVDKSCSEEQISQMKNLLFNINGVLSVDEIKTRKFGNRIYVDIEIGAYKNLTLETAHKIAEEAHDLIEKSDSNIKHCMVHVNPVDVKELETASRNLINDERASE